MMIRGRLYGAMNSSLRLGFYVIVIHLMAGLIYIDGCSSPTPISLSSTGFNSSTCPWRCCCNDDIRLVNCSRLYQNLPTVFPVKAKTIVLDWNFMDTFDRENCTVFKQSRLLEVLTASNNRIATINRNCFMGLGNLTVLNLSNNALTSVPLADTPYPFKILDLSNNNITQLNESILLAMPNLTSLNVDNNSISTLPSFLSSSDTKLRMLSLRNNGLKNIASLGPFRTGSGIEELYLSHNELSALPTAWLVGTFKLKVLDIRNATSMSDKTSKIGWTFPGYCEVLETIDLSLNGLRSIESFAFDSNTALQTIDLSSNDLNILPDDLLVKQVNLTTLKAHENRLVNISNGIWGKRARLEHINLANNSIERIEYGAISSLATLRFLDLSGNLLVSLTFIQTPDLISLETLLLHNNSIRVTPNLTRLIKLRVLTLQDNQLNEVPNVQNLSHLEKVDLSRNNISVMDTLAFLGAKRLKQINLEGNYIVSISEASLNYLPRSLTKVNLLDNLLRCDCNLALTSERVRSSSQWGVKLDNITCVSPPAYEGQMLINVLHSPCIGTVKSVKSIVLSALLAGIVIAVIILAFLYSRYRRVGRGNARRRSYPVEEKAAQMNKYEEEIGHLMSPSKNSENYHNLRGSNDLLGSASVTGSSTRINGNAIKSFVEEEFYV
ncbi:toll-like receptor 6 [Lytechinus pictus]|uniref:toll-like receptor 6 n=1 Tax=Lytechinus pictus TaxID=7653 RepID=UPI0030B9E95F